MLFYAYHGLQGEERVHGQQFEVDVEAILDLKAAGQSDKLEDTIDVNLIYDIVEEIILEGDFNLLETIAEHIAEALLDKLKISAVLVRARKPQAPVRGITAGIEVEIRRAV